VEAGLLFCGAYLLIDAIASGSESNYGACGRGDAGLGLDIV
jgi:hypothetical protein